MASEQNADVIVIGGGVIGLSAALQLKRLGVARVLVLERHHVGAGQSGRAAGIMRALVAHPAVSSMLQESIRFFRTFTKRYGPPIDVRSAGYLLIGDASQAGRIKHALATSANAGCRADLVSREEAAGLQPGLGVDDDCVCAFEPDAVWTDPMPAVQALAGAARALGVRIVEGCEIRDVLHGSGAVQGVESALGPYYSPQLLIATSVWGAAQLSRLGVTVPVYPHRVEMAFFQPASDEPRRLLRIVSDSRSQLYLRPEGSSQMFVGWREGDRVHGVKDFETADPDNYRQTAHYSSLSGMHRRLAITLPFMDHGFVHRTYACVYDYTPDGMPILDRAGNLSGLYFALGFSGGGFSLSPWVGRVMAEAIVTGSVPPEMALLGCSRFLENRPIEWSNAVGPAATREQETHG